MPTVADAALTLPCDAQIDGGQLKEGLVSVGSKNASEPDPFNPDIIARVRRYTLDRHKCAHTLTLTQT